MWPPHQLLGFFTSEIIVDDSKGSRMPSDTRPVTIDSLPPMWRSKLRTPDFNSCSIFPTVDAVLPAINSASMPKRCSKTRSISFLSSALEGTETTIFPSFLPASTVIIHPLCGDCPPSPQPDRTATHQPTNKTKTTTGHTSRPK